MKIAYIGICNLDHRIALFLCWKKGVLTLNHTKLQVAVLGNIK